MVFKINISDKDGKTYKLELESEDLIGKALHDKIKGTDILPALEGYELEITGTSDKSGFTSHKDVEGIGLKKVLLTEYGKGFKKRHRKEGKKKLSTPKPKGLRMRRTMRGNTISPVITQINMKVVKDGSKPLAEAFPDQNKPKVEEAPKEEVKPEEAPKTEETKPEEKIKKENDNDKTQSKGDDNIKSQEKVKEVKVEKDSLEKPVEEIKEEKKEEVKEKEE